jgi:two-component system, sensor histidine kinase and response regulator
VIESDALQASILYVDDIKTNLVLFQATFEKDFNIVLADSAKNALDILKEGDIQVLVTDQRMPDMTGIELLEKVAGEYPDIRRFILTAFTDYETVVDAVNRGHVHGYLNKPLQADEVRVAINNALEVYYLKKENQQILLELNKANEELKDLDGLKTEIIKVISTEIRNPLNRIMGTLHFLKDKIESQELISVVNILENSVSRLEEFSSMTEQISILKSPSNKIKVENVRFRKIIEYALVEVNENIHDKSIKLDLELDENDISIQGEFHLLVSCLVNLVNNGLAHTHSEDTLIVRSTETNGEVFCEIIDSGKDYSEQLFGELEIHFSESTRNMNLNLGIELGLAQMIMQAHGGRAIFQKTEDKKGSFRMVFKKDGIS